MSSNKRKGGRTNWKIWKNKARRGSEQAYDFERTAERFISMDS
jgi:hypothetical protein